MRRISIEEAEKQIEQLMEIAQVEPVVITKDGRDHLVMISAEEYERLILLAKEDNCANEASE